jgi:hypothetical protein
MILTTAQVCVRGYSRNTVLYEGSTLADRFGWMRRGVKIPLRLASGWLDRD